MKHLILILIMLSTWNANAKCITLSEVFIQQKFSSGEYLIQYRNGWTGLTAQSQHAKYDLAVFKPVNISFEGTGKFGGVLSVSQIETTTITIDGFDKKVPLFKETESCK